MERILKVNESLIGKYVNRYFYTDIKAVGKIVGIKGKTTIIVEKVVASENLNKMEFEVGGFSAHCVNNWNQKYEFKTTGELIEMRIGKLFYKEYGIDDKARQYYDYNF